MGLPDWLALVEAKGKSLTNEQIEIDEQMIPISRTYRKVVLEKLGGMDIAKISDS